MKNRPTSFLLAGLVLFQSVVFVRADDAVANPAGAPYEFEGSIVSEAVRATIGRVFGVGGEAANIEYHAVDLTEHKPLSAAVRSALIPGWGQSFNGQRVKGAVYFLSFAAATAGAILQHNRADQAYDDYRNKGLKDDALYDDYTQRRNQSLLLGGAAILCWAFSIVDAKRNAYQSVYSQSDGLQLAFNGERSDLTWRKRF